MSFLQDCRHVDVYDFPSVDQLTDQDDSDMPTAISCKNIEWVDRYPVTRRGFARVWNPALAILSMYNWVQQQYNRLVYINSNNQLVSRDLFTSVETNLILALTAAGAVFLQAAYRLYIAFFTSTGLGQQTTKVWDGTIVGSIPQIEYVFHEPLKNIELTLGTAIGGGSVAWGTWTTPDTGQVSPGAHYFVLVATGWNGYQTAPGPWAPGPPPSVSLVPIVANTTDPRKISVVVTPDTKWPLWVKSIQLAMTPTVDSSLGLPGLMGEGLRFFLVPGGTADVDRFTTTPVTLIANISDEGLLGSATEITDTLFNLYHATWTQDGSTVALGGVINVGVVSNSGIVTMANPHNLAVNQRVQISGATVDPDLNAVYYVNLITSPTQFTITTVNVANGTYNNAALAVSWTVSSGPTSPHCIFSLNNRTVYLTRFPGPDGVSLVGTILASEPFKPQYVTLAEHMLNLPEFRDTVTGFALGGTAFILGPNWTYAFSDNLRVPIFWAPPRLVSGDIGSPFIRGISVNQSRGYAWVADNAGLFCLSSGVYPLRPASYKQSPDWKRINFAAPANALCIKELPESCLVIVRAPLDGATSPTHLMVWDYNYGVSWDKIRYCGLWNIADYATLGDIEVVENYTTKVAELWITSGGFGDVRRQKSIQAGDATAAEPTPLYDDQGNGIDSAYRLMPVSRAANGVMQQIGGSFRVRGGGGLTLKAYSLDNQRTTTMSPIGTSEGIPSGSLLEITVVANVGIVSFALVPTGLSVGDRIEVSGATGDLDLNGYYVVNSFVGPLSFLITAIGVSTATYNNIGLTVSWGNVPDPGYRYLRLLDEQSEAISYELTNSAGPGRWFIWSAIRAYFKEWMEMR